MARRVLLIVNQSSGLGTKGPLAAQLADLLQERLRDQAAVSLGAASTHSEAAAHARAFLAEGSSPAAILVGGGGGTLRTVVEAVCQEFPSGILPEGDRVQFGTLRMGSGNLVAKQLGVPRDPVAAVTGLADSLLGNRVVPCCLVACRAGDSPNRRLHMLGLGGFGHFGWLARDVARWRRQWPRLRRLVTALLGLERWNHLAYCLAALKRACSCFLTPSRVEEVELTWPGGQERMRLLAGAVLNFPLPRVPFEPDVRLEEPAFSVHLIPFRSRWQALRLALFHHEVAEQTLRLRIATSQRLEVRLMDRTRGKFFLDENPETFERMLTLEVAGMLSFIPGPDYCPATIEADTRAAAA
jgi:diacylglycerol kinase family enzyme